MTDSMENLVKNKKEWDLEFLLSGVIQAIGTNDLDQALNLAKEGLEEAEGFSMIYTSKFEELIQAITLDIKDLETFSNSIDPPLENLEEENKTINQMNLENSLNTNDENIQLTDIPGIGVSTARVLYQDGIRNIKELAKENPETLSKIKGIGLKSAEKFIEIAKSQLESISKELKPEKVKIETLELDSKQDQKLFSSDEERNLENKDMNEELRSQTDNFNEFIEDEDQYNEIIKNNYKLKSGNENKEGTESPNIPKNVSNLHKSKNRNNSSKDPEFKKKINDEFKASLTNSQSLIKPKIVNISNTEDTKRFNNLKEYSTTIKSTFRDSNYHLFTLKDFSFDFLALKRIEMDTNKHLIFCFPILIDNNNEKILISENKLELFNKDKHDVLGDIQYKRDELIADTIKVEDIFNSKGDLQHLLERFIRTNLTLSNSNQSNKQIIFVSGPDEYNLIIQSIFICRKEPAFTEKVIPFAYERENNIYFISSSRLDALISYLEIRYFEVNKYSNNDYLDKKTKELRYEHLDSIQKISVPFMVIGFTTLIISIFFDSLLSPISIIMMIGSLGLYFALLGYEFKNYQNKLEQSEPHNNRIIDEVDIEILRDELSPEEMDQLIYEEFGKNHSINFVEVNQKDSKSQLKIDRSPENHSNFDKHQIRKDAVSNADELNKRKSSVYEKYLDILEE